MRTVNHLVAAIAATLILGFLAVSASAGDYNSRFVRNYPPGYYGMWYKAERFFELEPKDPQAVEQYRWDKFMSRITGVTYPFYPIPFDWDYGTGRTFNLPDYNTNDWR